ncbi:DUF6088 family protein [Fulvivirgaceae bacterium BMA12]|uniref:DUF6088 family protein n=1 Tax=Agaribacillus aureus TaxID=3051825 RepID=A0ABT8LDR0_9BACT|nr:DUF6088 family protein [Fulvivirgaceae bacterium BMA12]
MIAIKSSHSVEKSIINKLKKGPKGKIIFPSHFPLIGTPTSTRQAFKRLCDKGILIRLTHGIYLYPKVDESFGIIYPTIEKIAQVIAKRDHARIIPTGTYALHKLGLSTQVPLNIVFLTDGAPRSIKIGKQSIKFKKTTPKNLATKGKISSLVIQALREIGKDNTTSAQIKKITHLLQNEKMGMVEHDARLAPVWIAKILLGALNEH